eukprot:CAMPEP_0196677436 /NCGR_PEP_ID=MMETSP1090-20130531/5648_1 /TAXON_ID=37098 /ORGANISM="Isochrysis sp, Strain CCMP1244" /LENGTH=66 /DNA_ID=CAMNT_0042015519 /DNA_START=48 /DNA_END=245 /DNA_ORIENTATION=+
MREVKVDDMVRRPPKELARGQRIVATAPALEAPRTKARVVAHPVVGHGAHHLSAAAAAAAAAAVRE